MTQDQEQPGTAHWSHGYIVRRDGETVFMQRDVVFRNGDYIDVVHHDDMGTAIPVDGYKIVKITLPRTGTPSIEVALGSSPATQLTPYDEVSMSKTMTNRVGDVEVGIKFGMSTILNRDGEWLLSTPTIIVHEKDWIEVTETADSQTWMGPFEIIKIEPTPKVTLCAKDGTIGDLGPEETWRLAPVMRAVSPVRVMGVPRNPPKNFGNAQVLLEEGSVILKVGDTKLRHGDPIYVRRHLPPMGDGTWDYECSLSAVTYDPMPQVSYIDGKGARLFLAESQEVQPKYPFDPTYGGHAITPEMVGLPPEDAADEEATLPLGTTVDDIKPPRGYRHGNCTDTGNNGCEKWCGDPSCLKQTIHPYVHLDDLEDILQGFLKMFKNNEARAMVQTIRAAFGRALQKGEDPEPHPQVDLAKVHPLAGYAIMGMLKEDVIVGDAKHALTEFANGIERYLLGPQARGFK